MPKVDRNFPMVAKRKKRARVRSRLQREMGAKKVKYAAAEGPWTVKPIIKSNYPRARYCMPMYIVEARLFPSEHTKGGITRYHCHSMSNAADRFMGLVRSLNALYIDLFDHDGDIVETWSFYKGYIYSGE